MIWILLIIILVLALEIVFISREIKNITDDMDGIIDGNLNQRVRVKTHNRTVRNLVVNTNHLIDEFQRMVFLNKTYEEDRKKMISNISHDFRTPLTSMLGYIEMLKNDNGLSEQTRLEYIEIINIKGEILRNLIEEFFTLSKIDSNDVVFDFKKVNVTEVMRQTILSYLKDFKTNNIAPILEIPENDIYIQADDKALNRILQNIISNSLKYGTEGQEIGVSLKDMGEYINIEIWDRGKGIPEEDIRYIFDRSYTVEKSRNSKLQGSGLGLTIVKKLIEKHSGSIEVFSKPYEKTTFKITLPKKLRNM